YYEVSDGSWFCIRPSGTEPKIKIYIEAYDRDRKLANKKLRKLRKSILNKIKKNILISGVIHIAPDKD
ncbi:MAG: hypothetical protein GX494_06135, partial [Clostridiaceae bacterium]|nr:hypothetical protein [Clostridiaceae bacterium]